MFKSALSSSAIRGLTLLSKFILILYLARSFTTYELGLYGLTTATIGFFLYLVGIDFYSFNTREILAHNPSDWTVLIRDQFVFHTIAYFLVSPLVISVFLLGFLPWQYFFWFYLLLILEHLCQESHRILVVLSKPLVAVVAHFFRGGLWTYIFILLITNIPAQGNLRTLFFLWSLGNITSLIFTLYHWQSLNWTKAFKTPIDWIWIKTGIRVSLPLLVGTLALRGIMTIDRYALQHYWGEEYVGIYTFYASIAFVLQIFIDTGITMILYPKVVAAYQQKRWQDYKQLKKKFTKAVLGASLLLSLSAALLIYPVISLTQKAVYATYLPVYWILLLSVMVTVLTGIPHYSLYARRLDWAIISSNLTGLVVSLLANIILVPKFGQIGAAGATLLAMLTIGNIKLLADYKTRII
ncbi:MAG: polysaccharide biosynthesis C-terminal domain-containing protein [Coleofasciculus sp. A1-SPW-01]|uniref:hypothetical protein n=1 Tax=Coleofasciculus sp. A1-SPW-01 TaxID=3070819 RepID=UPI0032FC69A3